jgi:hypothetical protein
MKHADAVEHLRGVFRRNGYVRRQNPLRLAREGSQVYRKGEEVRLIARSTVELRRVRQLLRLVGFDVARPFVKGQQFCQPIYGREAVARFSALIAERGLAASRRSGPVSSPAESRRIEHDEVPQRRPDSAEDVRRPAAKIGSQSRPRELSPSRRRGGPKRARQRAPARRSSSV